MDIVKSKNGVPIRLTEERWVHITEEHSEMAGYYFEVLETVKEPEAIYEGKMGEYIAVREIEKGKYIVVVYRELSKGDGFVITAFLTRRKKQLERRRKIWQKRR
ncbi:MAG: PBECR2 nuclease fold domain-containing protein [Candidatus Methanospirare jalkutatii]|nr:PBECR2 nuclease fold domain-containing protein [Candidatus Methanospirare jalkutatii]